MKKLQYLVIHCTATPEGREVTSKDIRRMHTSPPPIGRGWGQVGYADMIHLDGTIENLVPHNENEFVEGWEITNGVAGMNGICRHVVYVGGTDKALKPKDTRTPAQLTSLESYVRDTISKHPDIKIAGHYQFDNGKACPSFKTPVWLKSIGIADKNIHV